MGAGVDIREGGTEVAGGTGVGESRGGGDEASAATIEATSISEDFSTAPSCSRSRPIAEDYRTMISSMNNYWGLGGLSSSSSSTSTGSAWAFGEKCDEEDGEEDSPRAAYAPIDPPHAPEPPTEPPGLVDLERNLADGATLASSVASDDDYDDDGGGGVMEGGAYYSLRGTIAELNETIASLEMRARAAEDEVRIDRARLEEALKAKEQFAAEYAYAARRYVDSERRRVEEVDGAAKAAAESERERSRADLKRLRDEHEESSEAASARLRRLRGALRSANDRKRRLERERGDARRRMESTEVRVGRRYAAEIDSLKRSLAERESDIRRMECLVMEIEDIVREERERLMAEIM